MVDAGRVLRLLDRLRRETERLSELAGRPASELLADEDALAAAQFHFIIAIEVCVDIGRHIIAAESLRAPDTYADVFRSLAEGEVVGAEQVQALQAMARFRNRLVHLYDETEEAEVVKALQQDLDDLARFRQQVAGYLTRDCTDR